MRIHVGVPDPGARAGTSPRPTWVNASRRFIMATIHVEHGRRGRASQLEVPLVLRARVDAIVPSAFTCSWFETMLPPPFTVGAVSNAAKRRHCSPQAMTTGEAFQRAVSLLVIAQCIQTSQPPPRASPAPMRRCRGLRPTGTSTGALRRTPPSFGRATPGSQCPYPSPAGSV